VVGDGSKVILTFANDGSLESFHYDWPTYQTAAAQDVVAADEVLSRVQRVVSVRRGAAAPVARVAGSEYPVVLDPSTQLEALECGYYDPGSGRSSQPIQPGCTYRAVSQDARGMRLGFAGAIPAAVAFDGDASWPETRILRGQ
jgi:hypothetical protein